LPNNVGGSAAIATNFLHHFELMELFGILMRNDMKSLDCTVPGLGASPEEVALRLKEAMKACGGHAALSERSGVPSRNLSNYLSGRGMRVAALVALADAAGVSVEWLACGRGPRVPNSESSLSSSGVSPAPIPDADVNYDQVSRTIEQVEKMVHILNLRLTTDQAADLVQRLYALSHVPPAPV
jgi:transcriptional regulator with XRE-family HTH domain